MTARRTLCLLVSLLGVSCTSLTDLSGTIDGGWVHSDPGLRYSMTLTTDGGAVSGVGQWYGEACCSGTVTVHGSAGDHTVDFDLDFVATQGSSQPPAPFSQHFTGQLVSADSLDGTLTSSGQSVHFGYRRIM